MDIEVLENSLREKNTFNQEENVINLLSALMWFYYYFYLSSSDKLLQCGS